MKKKVVIIALVMVVSLSVISPFANANKKNEEEVIVTPEPTEEIIDRVTYLKEHPEEAKVGYNTNAQAMARVADAVCPEWASDECKKAVMTCIFNRSKAVGFPDNIKDVAEQPLQWEGLTEDSVASEETIKLAKELLKEWEGVCMLPINRDCVFMRKTYDGIWFRSQWDGEDEVFVAYYE